MMHAWLGRVGYRAYLSGIVLNVQHSERMLAGLRRKGGAIQKETGARVSLIGHSRGGLLAKVYSRRKPEGVEQGLALGAPLAGWTGLAAITHHTVGVGGTAHELAFR